MALTVVHLSYKKGSKDMWVILEDVFKLAKVHHWDFNKTIMRHTKCRYDAEDEHTVRAGCNSTICVVNPEAGLIWTEFTSPRHMIRLNLSEEDDYIDDDPTDSLLYL